MKRKEEEKIIKAMIRMYCRKKHKTKKGLCFECSMLKNYALKRLELCPHGESKPFCSACPIHCYKQDMRGQIKKVMRFSGPRIIFVHPILAFKHLASSIKAQKEQKNDR